MKYLYLLTLIIFTSCITNKSNSTSIQNKEIEASIEKLVNFRKYELAIIIYEFDVKKMKEKYNINNLKELQDLSQTKLVYEKCLLISFRENQNDFEYKDKLGSLIVNKWKDKDYFQKYHFENYDQLPSLSLMKMLDFYNSNDLKKYSDSLLNETIRRYKSGKYPDLEECIKNSKIYLE